MDGGLSGMSSNIRTFSGNGISGMECVQGRLTCSMGVTPIKARVGSFVAWVASVEETKRMKPTDKAIHGMVSESPGCNESEPTGGPDKKINLGGRALSLRAKATWHDVG